MKNTVLSLLWALSNRGARVVVARGIVCALLLLTGGAALGIRGQERPPTGRRPTATATPTPVPTPQATPLKHTGRVTDAIGRGGQSVLTAGIYGTIRWKKEFGLPSTDSGQTPNKALNCAAFRVESNVQEGAPGTFGRASAVGYYTIQNEPTEENGSYVCRYSVTNRNPLPHDRVITVSAYLGPFADEELNRALRMKPWFGEGRPQPPLGQQRIPIGSRGVTLTDGAPRATVDFEVVYRPVPTAPR